MTVRYLVLAAVLATGCGTARVVYQSGNTGTIELSGDRSQAMAQANSELATMCGADNATIVTQGFEKTGSPSWIAPASAAAPVASQDPTQDGLIWRIHFHCGEAPPVAAPPGAAPRANGSGA